MHIGFDVDPIDAGTGVTVSCTHDISLSNLLNLPNLHAYILNKNKNLRVTIFHLVIARKRLGLKIVFI